MVVSVPVLLCSLLQCLALVTVGAVTGSHSIPATPPIVSQIHIAQGLTPSSMTISWVTPSVVSNSSRKALTSDHSYLSNRADSSTGIVSTAESDHMISTSTKNKNDIRESIGLRRSSSSSSSVLPKTFFGTSDAVKNVPEVLNNVLKSQVQSNVPKSQVIYSINSDDLFLHATGYSTSYTFNYKKLENYTSGILHHTTLENLRPNTVYYYKCGDYDSGSDADMSGMFYSTISSTYLLTLCLHFF